MAKEVVIIGGSFAGAAAARAILTKKSSISVNVTLISPSQYGYYSVAAPRLLIEPETLAKALIDIEEQFKTLGQPTHSFKFVKGFVVNVDLDERVVKVNNGSSIKYDNLIVASGSRSDCPFLKLDHQKDHQTVEQGIEKTAKDIKSAKTIAILGGGATGVEIAGELGGTYPDKEITLYTGAGSPLPPVKPSVQKQAVDILERLDVMVANDVKVTSVAEQGRKSLVTFDDGSEKSFDLAISTYKYTPNSSFLENYKDVLDPNGYIVTDEYLRLKKYPEVLALGDIVSGGVRSLVDLAYYQKPTLLKTIDNAVFGVEGDLKAYRKPGSPILFVPISRNGGVATAFGWGFPSFLVTWTKSKDFFLGKAKDSF